MTDQQQPEGTDSAYRPAYGPARGDHRLHDHAAGAPPDGGGPTATAAGVPPPGPGPLPPEAHRGAEQPGATPAAGRQESPLISPGALPAVLTALFAAVLAAGAALGRPALAVGVVALQALTAAGWFRLNGMWPARQGIALAFAAGLTADAALLTAGTEHAPTAMLGSLGPWCLLLLVLQLRDRSAPRERMYALTVAVAATVLTVIVCGLLAAPRDAILVGTAAVAVAVLGRALPVPVPVATGGALLAAVGAGIAVGGLLDGGGSRAAAALLGLVAGAAALLGLRVAAYDFPSRFVHLTAGVALPLAAAAPTIYVLGRALG